MKSHAFLILLAALALTGAAAATRAAGGAPGPAQVLTKEETEGLIFERQQLMKQMEEDAETLGDIVAGLQPPDKLGQVTRSLATAAHDMRATFEAKIPGGRTKPDVWANWPDYSKRMDDFELKAEEMAKLGEAGNLPAVTAMLGAALPCKECHDVYRLPKK